MRKTDIIKLAFKNFTRRKARSILTILGVVIGTMAVVIMLSIGEGLKSGMENQITQWGSITEINVYPKYTEKGTTPMNDETVATLKNLSNVVDVMPIMRGNAIIIKGKEQAWASITATDFNALKNFDLKLFEGEYPDVTNKEAIIMGYFLPFDFRNPKNKNDEWISPYDEKGNPLPPPFNPIEEKLQLTFDMSYGDNTPKKPGTKAKTYNIDCVAMTQPTSPDSYGIYMDISTYLKWKKEYEASIPKEPGANNQDMNEGIINSPSSSGLKNKITYENIKVKVNDRDNVKQVQKDIQDAGFECYSSMDSLSRIEETTRLIQAILGGIGAVAFIVAALGITNTMMMSTYERTREIGIMKVMGCRLRDIRDLFLTEAGIIGLLGGIVGLIFSAGISLIINMLSTTGILNSILPMSGVDISIIPFWLYIAGIIFPTLVGLISGFYPARRAIKLSALDAIKNE